MTARRRDLDVATRAWRALAAVPNGKQKDRYQSRARDLPAMLRTSGLAAALAVLGSNKDAGTRRLADDVMAELAGFAGLTGCRDVAATLDQLNASPVVLRRAEEHARVFADWLKRAAEVEALLARPPQVDHA